MDYNTFRHVDGSKFRFAIVRARFNETITQGLLDGALRTLAAAGVATGHIRVVEVPGSFEIIHAANVLAASERYDAVLCLGCIIKGATKHDEYLANAVYDAMKDITLKHGVPCIAGVLTVNDRAQADERSGDTPMNRGAEAAHTALEVSALAL